MKAKKEDEYVQFADWLKEEKSMNPKTAATYVSCVRKMASEIPDFEFEAVKTFTSNQKSKSVWRSAYRAYVIYMYACHEVQMEELKIFPMGRPSSANNNIITLKNKSEVVDDKEMPQEVVDALVEILKCGPKPEDLAKLYWCHFLETGKLREVEVPHPTIPNTWFVIPREAVQTVRKWAEPPDNGMIPFIPEAPGSSHTYNWAILRGILAVRKRVLEESESA